ncbi:MAG: hypothetical protein R3B09_27955 [Nannocystaceae bacterium]
MRDVRERPTPRWRARRGPGATIVGRLWVLGSTALALGCPPREAPQPPTEPAPAVDDGGGEPLPDPAGAPTNRSAGEELSLIIPRVDGSSVDLRDLRGRWVVLELTTTAAAWRERYHYYCDLVARQAGAVAVILVSLDADQGALSPEPEVRPPGFELGWDPQGALAAQLQAAAIPTVLLLDARGRVAAVAAGEGATKTIADALSSALAAP